MGADCCASNSLEGGSTLAAMITRYFALSTILLLAFACGSPPEESQPPQESKAPQAAQSPVAPTNPHAPANPHAASAPESAATPAKTPSAPGAAGELTFTAPSEWVVEAPTSKMRKAQYRLPHADGDTEDASLVVYYFGSGGGGGREANLERWAGQFEQPDGGDSAALLKSVDRTVNGLAVTDVELSGTYIAETTPGSGERLRKEGWRMLASIIEAKEGPYYAKLVGPAATIARWEPSYRAFIDAAKPAH